MFQILLIIHSLLRWLILAGLFFTSFKALYNLLTNGLATPAHFKIARLTRNLVLVATLIGILIYIDSPTVHTYLNHSKIRQQSDASFFGLIHPIAMLMLPIVTSGAMFLIKTSRTNEYSLYILSKFFGVSFMLALVSIPWPILDLVHRPLIRL